MNCLTVLKQSLSVLLKCPVETKTIRKDGIDLDLPTANGKKFIDAITAFRQTIKQIEQAKPVSDAEKAILDLRQAIELAEKAEPFEIEWPDYHPEAMGAGLEDRGITDKYEAIRHGWDQALEHVAERIPEKLYTLSPIAPAQLAVGNTTCNPHPDAPHGFARNASYAENRYVCKCEGWMPPVQPLTPAMLIEAALSASASGLVSGTTNWAKHIQQKLLIEQPLTCTWTEDAEGYYSTECGEAYVFNDGTPAQNNAVYCHHCGGKIVMGEPL